MRWWVAENEICRGLSTPPQCAIHCQWFNQTVNLLAPGGFDYSNKFENFKLISVINILSKFCEIAIGWMSQILTDHKSILVQVMAWCRQATSDYLSQCWPRSLSPYDVTRHNELKEQYFLINYIEAINGDTRALCMTRWEWWEIIIDLDYGWASNRRQVII